MPSFDYEPNLVVMTGYPCSGKSTVAEHLAEVHGYVRLSSDDLRESFFNRDYFELRKTPDGRKKERHLWHSLHYSRLLFLSNGFDVVVDSTALDDNLRQTFLYTDSMSPQRAVKKYVVHLKVDRQVLEARSVNRGRDLSLLENWDNHWQDPSSSDRYTLLSFENNTPADLENMLSSIDTMLRRDM